jgi:ABC-2 type transport system ATP-binding protein
MRDLLKELAGHGRTVLVSSHLLIEMQALADDVVIVANGSLVRQGSVAEVIESMAHSARVEVRTPGADELAGALRRQGAEVDQPEPSVLLVSGMTEVVVGDTAAALGLPVHRLSSQQADLEDAFLELTHGKAGIR